MSIHSRLTSKARWFIRLSVCARVWNALAVAYGTEGKPPVEFRKSRPVSLKAHAVYNEKWLQGLIAEDPGVLGLGDLIVKDVERRQPRAGRLDLLLSG